MLAQVPGAINPALGTPGFMGTGAAAAGAPGAAGAAGFLGFDMNMAAFNPYLFPFPPASGAMGNWMAPGMPASVGSMGGLATGSASSFHAPGAKNEIKLFVGGLPFQAQGNDIFFIN